MKTTSSKFLVSLVFLTLIMYGCSKTSDFDNPVSSQNDNSASYTPHVYGVLPATPEMVAGIPVFSKELMPVKADVSSWFLTTPAIRDQGSIGSCTGFCGAETDEILYYYKNILTNPAYKMPLLSPAFVYYCERVLILKQRINSDNGAYMVNIPQALQKYGDCYESSYPYPASSKSTAYKTAPKSTAMTEALLFRIGQFTNSFGIVPSGDVAAVKTLLMNNTPVMMGFNVYDNSTYTLFERLTPANCTYNPLTPTGTLVTGAKLLGSHAVPIIGFDDSQANGTGAFRVMNSWGTAWGDAGYFWMPYSVFKSTRIVAANNCYYAVLN